MNYDITLISYSVSPAGKLLDIEFSIRNLSATNSLVPSDRAVIGRINPDKTKLFSASFQKWFTLYEKEDSEGKILYCFDDPANPQNRPYELLNEVIQFAEAVTAEFYLLRSKI